MLKEYILNIPTTKKFYLCGVTDLLAGLIQTFHTACACQKIPLYPQNIYNHYLSVNLKKKKPHQNFAHSNGLKMFLDFYTIKYQKHGSVPLSTMARTPAAVWRGRSGPSTASLEAGTSGPRGSLCPGCSRTPRPHPG